MHKNARLTSKDREVQIQRSQAGQRAAEVAQAVGISNRGIASPASAATALARIGGAIAENERPE